MPGQKCLDFRLTCGIIRQRAWPGFRVFRDRADARGVIHPIPYLLWPSPKDPSATGKAPAPLANPITIESTWREKADARSAKFDGPGGLRLKMKAIKNAAKSQYGQTSSQYNQVKSIKL